MLVYDRNTKKEERVLRMPGQVRGVLSALGSVWITAGEHVVQVDPLSLRSRAETHIGGQAAQMAVSDSALIVTNLGGDKVTKLDAAGRVTASIGVGGLTIGITVDKAHVWAFFTDQPKARLIDRQSFEPGKIVELPGVAFDAAVVGDEVWAPITEEGVVAKLSSEGKVLGLVDVGRNPVGIRTHGEAVWVANEGESSLWRLRAAATTEAPS